MTYTAALFICVLSHIASLLYNHIKETMYPPS